jgi:iron complex outermembrane receptor protein
MRREAEGVARSPRARGAPRSGPAAVLLLGALLLGRLAAAQDELARQDPQQAALPSEEDLYKRIREREEESSTKRRSPLVRAPSTVSVLDADEVERLGLRFLPDALRRLPGMEVARTSSTESNVSLRGYNDDSSAAQGILGLVDGRQVINEFFGAVFWESLPLNLEHVDRLEVVRGPGSFVHGPNAMHGLVNVVTKSPLQYSKDTFDVRGAAGSYRSVTASVVSVRRGEDYGLKAMAGLDDISEFEPRDRNARDKKFFEARYETEFDKGHRLDVAGGASGQKFDVLIPTFQALPPVVFFSDAQEAWGRATYRFGDFRAQVWWERFEATSQPEKLYTGFDWLLDVADLDLQYSLSPIEGHTATAGFGYRFAAVESGDEDITDGRHKTGLTWAFLQDEIELGPSVWVTAGFRRDDHTITGNNGSPRLAVVWQVAPENYLRASASYGFRNPSLREIWFDMPINVPGLPGPVTVQGNRDLDSERMRSFELSYTGSPMERLRVEGNLYYNLVDRLVEFKPTQFFAPGVPSVLRPENVRDEEAYGLDLEASYLAAPWLWTFANYATVVRQDQDTDKRDPSAPRHKGNSGARMTLGADWTAMVWVNYFDRVEFTDPTGNLVVGKADAYALLNARLAYRMQLGAARGQVFLQAFNLLDHDHREHPEGHSYGQLLMGGLEVAW